MLWVLRAAWGRALARGPAEGLAVGTWAWLPNQVNLSSRQAWSQTQFWSLGPTWENTRQYKIKLNSINHRPKLQLYFKKHCAVETARQQREAVLVGENLCAACAQRPFLRSPAAGTLVLPRPGLGGWGSQEEEGG